MNVREPVKINMQYQNGDVLIIGYNGDINSQLPFVLHYETNVISSAYKAIGLNGYAKIGKDIGHLERFSCIQTLIKHIEEEHIILAHYPKSEYQFTIQPIAKGDR